MSDDIDIVARTLFGEARAYDEEDAKAIACVIMNRVRFPNWPDTPAAVCMQPWQFSAWNQNDPNRERIMNASGDWWERCKAIAADAVAGRIEDFTFVSTHYHLPTVNPKWSRGKEPCFKSSSHRFYNDIDTPPPRTAKEALDQDRPLSESRTMTAAKVGGGAATVGAAVQAVETLSPTIPILERVANLPPLVMLMFLLVALGALGWMVWARLDDRVAGRR